MRPSSQFTASLWLCTFVSLPDERSANLVPLVRVAKVLFIIVGCAFALHVRLVWCRVQPMLVIALLLATVLTQQTTHRGASRPLDVFDNFPASRTSSYECARYLMLRPRWNLVLLAYAAWIAYGALFHEGRHFSEDLAILDGLLLPGDIGSAWIVSALRTATLFIVCVASMSPEHFLAARNSAASASFALLLYAALLALPPTRGVPQVLSVAETLLRCAAFLLMYFAAELWRVSCEHYAFVAQLCENTLTGSELEELRAVVKQYPAGASPKYTMIIDKGQQPQKSPEPLANIPQFLTILQSAWILSAPNNLVAGCVAIAFCAAAAYCTARWPKMATLLLRARCGARAETDEKSASPSPVVPIVPKLEPAIQIRVDVPKITQRRQSPPVSAKQNDDFDEDEFRFFVARRK